MAEQALTYLEYASWGIALFAVALIVFGFLRSSVRYATAFGHLGPAQAFAQLKIELAQVLTLGLEILVLADVIETITVGSSFESLAILATLVVVRTILSWTLALQIEGHWPWQHPSGDEHA